jgi:hypothetical protein
VQAVIAYVDSMRSLYGSALPQDRWPDVLEAATRRVAATIEHAGAWTTRSCVGLLLARPAT